MVGASLSSARPTTYCTELATDEKTLFAFEPTNRMVPTTITRITANITAYSAISWASSPTQAFQRTLTIFHLPWGTRERLAIQEGCGTAGKTLTRSRAKWLAFTPKCTADCALLLPACQAKRCAQKPVNRGFWQSRPCSRMKVPPPKQRP